MKSLHIAKRSGNLPSLEREAAAFVSRHARKHPLNRVPRRNRGSLRARVEAAFRTMANGCSPATAFARTKDFHRSGGAAWTPQLR